MSQPSLPTTDPAPITVRPGAPGWLRSVLTVARRLDESRWSPLRLAERAVDGLEDRRSVSVGSSDQTNVGLEPEDRPSLQEWKSVRALETSLVPDPWWLPLVRAAGEVRLARVAGGLVAALDRLRRGWDETDAWSMTSSLPVHVGEQLAWLADHSQTWPGETHGYADPESWVADLRHHARVLTTPAPECSGAAEDAAHATVVESLHWVAEHLDLLWD